MAYAQCTQKSRTVLQPCGTYAVSTADRLIDTQLVEWLTLSAQWSLISRRKCSHKIHLCPSDDNSPPQVAHTKTSTQCAVTEIIHVFVIEAISSKWDSGNRE